MTSHLYSLVQFLDCAWTQPTALPPSSFSMLSLFHSYCFSICWVHFWLTCLETISVKYRRTSAVNAINMVFGKNSDDAAGLENYLYHCVTNWNSSFHFPPYLWTVLVACFFSNKKVSFHNSIECSISDSVVPVTYLPSNSSNCLLGGGLTNVHSKHLDQWAKFLKAF